MIIQFSQHYLLMRLSFSFWAFLTHFQTLVECVFKGLLLGTQFLSIDHGPFFWSAPYCLDDSNWNIVLNQEMCCFQLCAFTELLWLFRLFGGSIPIIRLLFSISVGEKKVIAILVGTVLTLEMAVDMVRFFQSKNMGIFPFVCLVQFLSSASYSFQVQIFRLFS